MSSIKEFLFAMKIPLYLKVILASMIPFVEARYAILFFTNSSIPFHILFVLSVFGNMIPVPFIILLFRPLLNLMKKNRLLKPLADKMENKALLKAVKIKKYEAMGLFLFVALPIPGTGAISGALGAAMLNLRMKYALPAILAGTVIATLITSGALRLILTII